MSNKRRGRNRKSKPKRQRVMREWTVPAFPWTLRTFQNKSVPLLKWLCGQHNIDISDQSIYKKGVKPYQRALLNWYQSEHLESSNSAAVAQPRRMLYSLF